MSLAKRHKSDDTATKQVSSDAPVSIIVDECLLSNGSLPLVNTLTGQPIYTPYPVAATDSDEVGIGSNPSGSTIVWNNQNMRISMWQGSAYFSTSSPAITILSTGIYLFAWKASLRNSVLTHRIGVSVSIIDNNGATDKLLQHVQGKSGGTIKGLGGHHFFQYQQSTVRLIVSTD